MKTFITFFKKEVTEQIRTKKLMILCLLFAFFGIMNPLTAKITPWLLETMSESMENTGIIVTDIEVTALDSWMQFFKNIPMLLVIFIFMQSGIFAKEYQDGTLTLVITKGFERYKIVIAKILVMVIVWTVGYLICFGITFAYTVYFWDNSIASHLCFSSLIWWLFGVFIISLFAINAINFENSGGALSLTAVVVFVIYLISLLPKVNQYLPTLLTDGYSLVSSLKEIKDYFPSLIITIVLTAILLFGSIFTFNKKKIK